MAAAADPVTVNFQQQGTHLIAWGELTVPVSAATAWEVLTDYEHVPEFVPGMRVSRVLEQTGNICMVDQQGEMMANNLRMFFQGVLKIIKESPDRPARSLALALSATCRAEDATGNTPRQTGHH